jgi:hypothetical protein
MMMRSTFTSSLVLLLIRLVSSTAAAEFIGLRNFELALSATLEDGFGPCTTDEGCEDEFPECKRNSQSNARKCYCQKAANDCDAEGQCVFINPASNKMYRRVCGCDGAPYPSESAAKAHGVNVKHNGDCSAAPSSDVAVVE